MADHASPRTTQLYDRTGDEVTLDEVAPYEIPFEVQRGNA